MKSSLDWTHKSVHISDIRKLNKLYVLKLHGETPDCALFVKDTIFEERLKSYFLKDLARISRDDIMDVTWNMYISQGYYVKYEESTGDLIKYNHDPEKWYISYLEIDGALGNFCSIFRDKDTTTATTNIKL